MPTLDIGPAKHPSPASSLLAKEQKAQRLQQLEAQMLLMQNEISELREDPEVSAMVGRSVPPIVNDENVQAGQGSKDTTTNDTVRTSVGTNLGSADCNDTTHEDLLKRMTTLEKAVVDMRKHLNI